MTSMAAKDDRFERQVTYSCDLQRIIEDLCHNREIRMPETTARFHYDMAVAYRRALIAPVAAGGLVARAEAEGQIMREFRIGNLTPLGVANHLRRAGFNMDTAVAKANALIPAKPAVEVVEADIAEFMRRLGPRWFLEQNWFPQSLQAPATPDAQTEVEK